MDRSFFSDLHKDALGFRRRFDWSNWSDEKFAQEVEWLEYELECKMEIERTARTRAITDWQNRLHDLQVTHGISLQTAVRWDMESMDTLEAGYYCYLTNIGYEQEPFIQACLAAEGLPTDEYGAWLARQERKGETEFKPLPIGYVAANYQEGWL